MLTKRALLRSTLAVAAAATLGFSAHANDQTLKIGVTAGPHAQIMEVVK
ncbi:MAG: metal ABC transporter substrate-binding protein, partial [Comamonas sp.]